jgi:biopolymer transport protein ExbD
MGRLCSRRSSETPQEPLINITPLIDVVFVVLIAFIVIAPLLEQDRVALSSGGAPSHSPIHFQDASSIQIHVYQDNSVSVNQEKVSMLELPRVLRQIKKQFPKARPQLFHDKKAYFGTYQQVKNTLEVCGFQEMDIVLSPS